MFKIAARTILELGAELISSDAIAIYELVKNAVDAGSRTGVTLEFNITYRHSDYVDQCKVLETAMKQEQAENWSGSTTQRRLAELKRDAVRYIQVSAPTESKNVVQETLESSGDLAALLRNLHSLYSSHNWIEIRDTGCGMTVDDLLNSYMVVGTPSRRKTLDLNIQAGAAKASYLGEKGVGRLSVMRLGSQLAIRTATVADKRDNHLDIDWTAFEDLNKMVEDITFSPYRGKAKPTPDYSGTVLHISNLRASWSLNSILEVATWQLARITDPFTLNKRRFRIEITFNGERVEIPRLDHHLLELALAKVTGSYQVVDGRPSLELHLSCGDLGKDNAPEQRRIFLERVDLRSITKEADSEIAAAPLQAWVPSLVNSTGTTGSG